MSIVHVSRSETNGSLEVMFKWEVKVDYLAARNVVTRPATTLVSQYGGGSCAAMFSEGENVSGGRPTVNGLSVYGGGSCATMFSEGGNVSGGRPTINGLSLMLLVLHLMLRLS
nr:hypothetical protein [Tanacetum cinerariifolium]